MLLIYNIPGVGRVFRRIRRAIDRSSQSSSSSIEISQETSITAEINEPIQADSTNPTVQLQRNDNVNHLICQAVQQGSDAEAGCLLFVNLRIKLFDNLAAQFTKITDATDPLAFWLKNECIQGYVALAPGKNGNMVFTISSTKQSDGCKFRSDGPKIQVPDHGVYVMVDDNDGYKLVTTTCPQKGTNFMNL